MFATHRPNRGSRPNDLRRRELLKSLRGRVLLFESLENRQMMAIDSLFVSQEGTDVISRLSPDGATITGVTSTGPYPTDVVYNSADNELLWVEQLGSVFAASANGGSRQTLASNVNGLAIAQDPLTRDVYFSNAGKIERIGRDGAGRTTLLSGLGAVTAIAVDREHDRLYWSEVVSGGKIRYMGLDGSNPTTLVTINGGSPESMALDTRTGSVYWVDQNFSTLNSIRFDGTEQRVLRNDLSTPKSIAVDSSAERLYVANLGSGTVFRGKLDGSDWTMLRSGLSRPEGIALAISKPDFHFSDVMIDEDSGPVTFDLSKGFANSADGQGATYNVSASGSSLVTPYVDDSTLTLLLAEDGWGEATIHVEARTSTGESVEADFMLVVNPVNDRPRITRQPDSIAFSDAVPTWSFDLSTVVVDVDDSALDYRIVSDDNPLVGAELHGGKLTLNSATGVKGAGSVTVEASDAAGLTARLNIDFTVDRGVPTSHPPAESTGPTYVDVSDQVLEFGGEARITTDLRPSSPNQVRAITSNPAVLALEDVRFEFIEGKLVVRLHHSAKDYGASWVAIMIGDRVAAQFTALVVPTVAGDTAEFSPNFGMRIEHVAHGEVSEISQRVDARQVAAALRAGVLSADQALTYVAPGAALVRRMVLNSQTTPVQTVGDGNVRVTFPNVTFEAGADGTMTQKFKLSATYDESPPQTNDGLSSSEKDVVDDAVMIVGQCRLDRKCYESEAKSKATEWAVSLALQSPWFAAEYFGQDKALMAEYRALIGKQVSLTFSSFSLVGNLAGLHPSNPVRMWQSAVGVARDLRSIAGSARDVMTSLKRLEGLKQLRDATFTNENVISGRKLAAGYGKLHSIFFPDGGGETPTTTALKEVAQTTWTESESANRVSQVFNSVDVGLEYAQTIVNIAGHVDSILDKLFGPDDLYKDKDGVERSWSADQRRTPTPQDDNVTTGTGDDRIDVGLGDDKVVSNQGDDLIDGGDGANRIDAGSGNDRVTDGAGDSFIDVGSGADVVFDWGGNDLINLGPGQDILVYPGAEIGRDVIHDAGRSSLLQLPNVDANRLRFGKLDDNLTISVNGTTDELKLVGFFRDHDTHWRLEARNDVEIDLNRIVGRIDPATAAYFALRQDFGGSYDDFEPVATISATSGSLEAHIYARQRPSEATTLGRQLLIALRSPDDSLSGWLERNGDGGLANSLEMLPLLSAYLDSVEFASISVVGHSSAGAAAQWIGAALGARGDSIVDVTTVNAPDVSGRIRDVLATDFPEYRYGFANISTTHLVHSDDPISKLGMWADDGLGSSSWLAWKNNGDTDAWLFTQRQLEQAHSPDSTEFTRPSLEFTRWEPQEVARHVSLFNAEDLCRQVFRVGVVTDETQNLRWLLAGREAAPEDGAAAERSYRSFFSPNANSHVVFRRQFDFGPVGTNVAAGYSPVSQFTIYDGVHHLAGWREDGADVVTVDRAKADSLERDFAATSDNEFIVSLAADGVDLSVPRTYNVTFVTGDRDELRESMVYYVNGFYFDTVATMPNQFLTHALQITTTDSELRLAIKDRGGNSSQAIINGLTVEMVPHGAPLPSVSVPRKDESIVVLTHGYTIPGWVSDLAGAIKQVVAAVKDYRAVTGAFAMGGPVLAGLKATEIALRRIDESLAKNDDVRATSRVHEFVFEAAEQYAAMSRRFRLGALDPNVIPVDLGKVLKRIKEGASDSDLLKLWEGSRDFLALDWTDESSEGSGVFDLLKGDFSEERHRNNVESASLAYKRLIDARISEMRGTTPNAQLDVLLVSHSYGYNVNRDLADRLSYSSTSSAIDYLKLVTLDPVSMKPDELIPTERQSDRFDWYHPELTPEIDAISNYFQTEGVFHTKWYSIGIVTPDLQHLADNIEKQIVSGRPLDGRDEGEPAGFYNRQARLFDLPSSGDVVEQLRWRHWDPNSLQLSTAELTDIQFSPDDSLIATSDANGQITVRYVDALRDPADPQKVLRPAGEVKFAVFGQAGKVRAMTFMQMEVEEADGRRRWRDYLLSVRVPRNEGVSPGAGGEIVLTDVETGLNVWRSRFNGGTQIGASPSGNVLVATDSDGRAQVWRRIGLSTVFTPSVELDVDANAAGYVADLQVINDRYFVTAGMDERLRLVETNEHGARVVQIVAFDGAGQGAVRRVAYDPYNGLLAVGAGSQLSLWNFDQHAGLLTSWSPPGGGAARWFTVQDHIKSIQGVAFSKPAFLLDSSGVFRGDHGAAPGVDAKFPLPRSPQGDIDIAALREYLRIHNLPAASEGLKLATGGEDRTVFTYGLDRYQVGALRELSVFSGAMLPIRQLTFSANGNRLAVIGADNIEGDIGGPVDDQDVTKAVDKRLGFKLTDLVYGGMNEHNEVPRYYLEDVVASIGESYFWNRDNPSASRPGDLDPADNLALPPFKRANRDGLDVEPLDFVLRPGESAEIRPLRYLLEVNRADYHVVPNSFQSGVVRDADGNSIGTLSKLLDNGGKDEPKIIFTASRQLDFSTVVGNAYESSFTLDLVGPMDADGNRRRLDDVVVRLKVVDHHPVAISDSVDLYPGSGVVNFRPLANDYDVDGDSLGLAGLPRSWQPLKYGDEVVAKVSRNESNPKGLDFVMTITAARLQTLLAANGTSPSPDDATDAFVPVKLRYQAREEEFGGVAQGEIELRLRLRSGPDDVRYDHLGADQLIIEWTPPTWKPDKYVIERFDDAVGRWVKHSPDAESSNGDAGQLKIRGLEANTAYWFRVVAVNARTGRRYASYEGADKFGGLSVVTPDYSSPPQVSMTSRGPTQIEVTWDKVEWGLENYVVKLSEIALDANGAPLRDENGYVFAATNIKPISVGANDEPRAVFKQLKSGATYLAFVVAQDRSRGLALGTWATTPATTVERDAARGIEIERSGPNKMLVSWNAVPYAKEYRVVAVDPNAPLAANRISSSVTATNAKQQNAVLKGLNEQTSYVVFVDALVRSGQWISILSTENPPIVVGNTPSPAGRVLLSPGGTGLSRFLVSNDFRGVLQLPSLENSFVGAELSILTFSGSAVTVEAAAGETLLRDGASAASMTLSPTSGSDAVAGTPVVYRYERTLEGWQVEVREDEARLTRTPGVLAAESGSFGGDPQGTLPTKLKVLWDSPYWNVDRHRIEIFEALLDSDGLPYRNSDQRYARSAEPAAPMNVKLLDEAPDLHFAHTFENLREGTSYVVVLTTIGKAPNGSDRVAREELLLETSVQRSPTCITSLDITLTSFTAVWTPVNWNVREYRVVVWNADAQGNPVGSPVKIVSADRQVDSKLIPGLETGGKYVYTVEARSRAHGWLGNSSDNFVVVRLRTPEDLSIDGLVQTAKRSRQIDLAWERLTFVPDELYVEIRLLDATTWHRAAGGRVTVGQTKKTLEDLELNTAYEIRLAATVSLSGNRSATIFSRPIVAETEWSFQKLEVLSPSELLVEFRRLPAATRYEVSFYQPGGATPVWSKNLTQKTDKTQSWTARGLTPGESYEVEIAAFENAKLLTRSGRESRRMLAAPGATDLSTTAVRKQQIDLKWGLLGWTPDALAIEVRVAGAKNWSVPTNGSVAVGKTSVTVTELLPATSYEVRLVATLSLVNDKTYRAESPVITRKTDAYPMVPGLKVDQVGPDTARVQWNQLSEGGVTNYRVRVFLAGTQSLVLDKTVDVGSGPRGTTVANLTQGVKYDVLVEALRNGVVLSDSGRTSFTTLLLPAPSGLQLVAARKAEFDLRWNSLGWTPTEFYVEVRKSSSSSWTRPNGSSLSASATQATIKGLAANTSYDIRLVATRKLDNGDLYWVQSGHLSAKTSR